MDQATERCRCISRFRSPVAADQLLNRAQAIASAIVKQLPTTIKYTRIGLTEPLRRVIDEGIGYGLALEGITAAEVARIVAAQPAA